MPAIDFNYNELKTFYGYYKNDRLLKSSASGGAATILAESMINSGGVVYGAVYSSDYKTAEYGRFEKGDDLAPYKSSKYIPTQKKVLVNGEHISVFNLVAEDLINGRAVLFTGLGCDIAAVISYIHSKGIDDSYLYTVDLICHGTTLREVGTQYIEKLEAKYDSTVVDFNVRYKKVGTNPHYLRAVFKNGKIYEKEFYKTEYGVAFSKYSGRACYSCQFKGNKHIADITIGDFWGQDKNSEGYNNNGVSIFFSRTTKGDSMIEGISLEDFYLRETDTYKALQGNPMFWINRTKLPNSEKFEERIKVIGLSNALKECETIKEKLRHTYIYKMYMRIKSSHSK